MANPRLEGFEDALVSIVATSAATATSGMTVDPQGVRAVTPLSIQGMIAYGRPQALTIVISSSDETYRDSGIGGNEIQQDVIWETSIIIMTPIRSDAIAATRTQLMDVADAIRDDIANAQPLTSPYKCFPLRITRAEYRDFPDSGWVALTMRILSGMQYDV